MTKKQIHIEKYDMATFEKEKKPYVMICTDVIQRIEMKYSQAFLLWVFLESLPVTWVPNRYHLMEHFQISESTYERHMHWLNTVGLIEYRQKRDSGGTFGKGHLVVLNGTKFDPEGISNGTVKIDGTVINKKKAKVIHISEANRDAKFGDTAKQPETRASTGLSQNSPNRQITEVRSDDAHINTTEILKKERKKTNNPVSVFADALSVKTRIEEIVANRKAQEPLDNEIIEQGIFYCYTQNDDKSEKSVNKKINIFLKLVRENKWLIPHGYEGITTKSIREKEEAEQRAKREQYEQEALSYKDIVSEAARRERDISIELVKPLLKVERADAPIHIGNLKNIMNLLKTAKVDLSPKTSYR